MLIFKKKIHAGTVALANDSAPILLKFKKKDSAFSTFCEIIALY